MEDDLEIALMKRLYDEMMRLDADARARVLRYLMDRLIPPRSPQAEGGRARAAKLSPEERSNIAKKAAAKRWGGQNRV